MRRNSVIMIVGIVLIGIAVASCGSLRKGSKKSAAVDGRAEGSGEYQPPDIPTMQWEYEADPTPAIEGSPDTLLTSFTFERGGSVLKQEAIGAIGEAYAELEKTNPEANLALIGFADGITEAKGAEKLGLDRAERARAYFAKLGMAKEQMQVASFGTTQSIAQDHEVIQQSRDRKVEVWVLR